MLWPIGSGDAFKGVLDRRSRTVALFERGVFKVFSREENSSTPGGAENARIKDRPASIFDWPWMLALHMYLLLCMVTLT